MSAASRRLLAHLIERRWPLHLMIVCGYAFALVATAHGWYGAPMMYYGAAMLALFRVDEGAILVNRSTRLLPLSIRERDRLLWMWVFVAPFLALALSLAGTWLISGVLLGHSVTLSAVISLYLCAPFSLVLLTSRLPPSRAVASARMIAALIFLLAAFSDLTNGTLSKSLLLTASAFVVAGLSFPLWANFDWRSSARRETARGAALVKAGWPTGVFAMIWLRVRASVPSILVMAAFILVMSTFSSRHRASLGMTISLISPVVMGYIWMSNWRWLCHFRALRCLPLSSGQLTALTLGVSVVPSATVWVLQYIVTGWLLAEPPVSATALLALGAVQLVTVPVFLYAPGWLRSNWLAAVLPTLFLIAQSLAAMVGVEQFQPWIQSLPRAWLVVFVGALAACVVAAVLWTHREIAGGRHAYRAQPDDWAPPSWAWPE